MTDPRCVAIRALDALPLASELVGLALDFATDLRCSNATYFDPAHGIHPKYQFRRGNAYWLRCCRAVRDKELMICSGCWISMRTCKTCLTSLCQVCAAPNVTCGSCHRNELLCAAHKPNSFISYGWRRCNRCWKSMCSNCSQSWSWVCSRCRLAERK